MRFSERLWVWRFHWGQLPKCSLPWPRTKFDVLCNMNKWQSELTANNLNRTNCRVQKEEWPHTLCIYGLGTRLKFNLISQCGSCHEWNVASRVMGSIGKEQWFRIAAMCVYSGYAMKLRQDWIGKLDQALCERMTVAPSPSRPHRARKSQMSAPDAVQDECLLPHVRLVYFQN